MYDPVVRVIALQLYRSLQRRCELMLLVESFLADTDVMFTEIDALDFTDVQFWSREK
jgi:hypothetical protein